MVHALDRVPARLLHRVDRDLLHRGAAVPAGVPVPGRGPRVGGHAGVRYAPDQLPDAPVRLGPVLPEGRRPARGEDRRPLSRRDPLHRAPGGGDGAGVPIPGAGDVAAAGDWVVRGHRRLIFSTLIYRHI